MQVEYTGRQCTVTAKLKQQAEAGLARLAKIVDPSARAHVILTEDKYRKIAEVTVMNLGDPLVGLCEDTDMEKALHDALNRVEQQACRHKDRAASLKRHSESIRQIDPFVEPLAG